MATFQDQGRERQDGEVGMRHEIDAKQAHSEMIRQLLFILKNGSPFSRREVKRVVGVFYRLAKLGLLLR